MATGFCIWEFRCYLQETEEQLLDDILQAPESSWSATIRKEAEAGRVSRNSLTSAIRKRMETIVLALPSGSNAQRIQVMGTDGALVPEMWLSLKFYWEVWFQKFMALASSWWLAILVLASCCLLCICLVTYPFCHSMASWMWSTWWSMSEFPKFVPWNFHMYLWDQLVEVLVFDYRQSIWRSLKEGQKACSVRLSLEKH